MKQIDALVLPNVTVAGTDRPPRRRRWPLIPAGLLAGALLGVLGRVWMRWISTDPEFSWSGTLFIVGAFTVFGVTQAMVAVARIRLRRRSWVTVARILGVVFTLPLFAGAGSLMLPTVIGGGLALWRTDWHRAVRFVAAALAVVPVAIVAAMLIDDFGAIGATPRTVGLLVVYVPLIAATRFSLGPLDDGWRAPLLVRIAIGVLGVGLLALLAGALVGIG